MTVFLLPSFKMCCTAKFSAFNFKCQLCYRRWHHNGKIPQLTSLSKSLANSISWQLLQPLSAFCIAAIFFQTTSMGFNRTDKILLVLIIFLSHTPPFLLAESGFCLLTRNTPHKLIYSLQNSGWHSALSS